MFAKRAKRFKHRQMPYYRAYDAVLELNGMAFDAHYAAILIAMAQVARSSTSPDEDIEVCPLFSFAAIEMV